MKKFTKQEILELYGQVTLGEISLSRMVEIINERVSKVEEPNFKDGDFLHSDWENENITLIYKKKKEGKIYNYAYKSNTLGISCVETCWSSNVEFYPATKIKKQELLNALAKKGKRWNEEKKCVEDIPKQKYKEGDFLTTVRGRCFILKNICGSKVYDHAFLAKDGLDWDNGHCCYLDDIAGYCTQEEKLKMIAALKEDGKRWNDDKKCIENIPKRKFKKGDKVRIKNGISSRTVNGKNLLFNPLMDELIGTTMTVDRYTHESGYVMCNEYDWSFLEDWLEPYEELKKGDLAIFWDENKEFATIRMYDRSNESEEYFRHKDQNGINWKNAIKFESKEQYEKLLKGEI